MDSDVVRLRKALFNGHFEAAHQILAKQPDVADGQFALEVALYRREAVAAALAADPSLAVQPVGPRTPILHLAFSKWLLAAPECEADMVAIAEMLVAHGADVNDAVSMGMDGGHPLSALYGAIGHAGNMPLGRWLLEHGANANDGESLYHATELGHHEGLRMLLEHGADPKGTNALLRAMDFHDVTAVRMLIDAGGRVDDFEVDELGGKPPWTVPALHQAARRMSRADMVEVLLEAGADPEFRYEGLTPYARARVFGNAALAAALEARGADQTLTPFEGLLAQIADGGDIAGAYLNPDQMPQGARNIIREILHLPGKLGHIKRLVAAGAEYDRPDGQGVPPVQVAGWQGMPEMMGYFLSLKPDLSHVNGYGGTLLGAILHGAEQCAESKVADYLTCLKMVLTEGVALPRRVVDWTGVPEVAAFLRDWAARHPGQIVDDA